MAEPVYFLDVNVPMYAAGKAHPYKESCTWILRAITEGRLDTAIDVEIIQAVLYRYGAIQRPEIGVQMANSLLRLIPNVLPITPAVVVRAIHLFANYGPQGVKVRDVIHVAVMESHDLTHIISTDKHFDPIEGIVRIDPQILFAQR